MRIAQPLLLTLIAFFFTVELSAQDARLAQQYYQDAEYEKAASIYEELYSKNQRNDYYFDKYIECLTLLEDFDTAEKIVKREIGRKKEEVKLFVTYGNLLELQFKDEEAVEQYEKAVKKLPADKFYIHKLANAFLELRKYEYAIQTYERGTKLLNSPYEFSYNLAELYRRKGEAAPMIEQYLNTLYVRPERLNTVQQLMQRYLEVEDYDLLKEQLYARIQDEPDAFFYTELLTWVFIQEKDYKRALRQVRALDKRLNENGGRIYRLAQIAYNDKSYDAAIAAFDAIVKEKGATSSFYLDAKRESLRARRSKLVEGFEYTNEDLRVLEAAYEVFLSEFGRTKVTAPIILELAELQAYYLNDLEKATMLLSEVIEYPGLNRFLLANIKLNLADFYLMQDEIWEATLLYSQVDKEFRDDLLGHEARYRNARLSYFAGDFQWAQAQFDVLKASTSKLIANDALDKGSFIMDNLGLDTTAAPLELYADAELLVFQNRFEAAFLKLDTLLKEFPSHGLQDDILYLKAQVYKKQRNYEATRSALQAIVDNHTEEIRADNALYELAMLYENQLNDKDKAKELYEQLFIDFSGSTFAVEARKRYRILRGDEVQ